jgi:Glycosyltransferase sugar-binding region containing DXD motif
VIPKIIHYFWFSDDPLPPLVERCLASWRRVLPGFEIRRWGAREFDVNRNRFVAEAYALRRWAFVTDYARLYAVHTCGGIYLDTDVEVRRPLDDFLGARVFTAVEYHYQLVERERTYALLDVTGRSLEPFTRKPGIGLQAAVVGGEAGHPFLRDCLAYYESRPFVLEDGSHFDRVIAPDVYAMVAEGYGFRYRDERQHLREGIVVLPSEVFAGAAQEATRRSHAVHYSAGGWRPASTEGRLRRAARRALDLVGVRPLWHRLGAARSRARLARGYAGGPPG